MHEVRMHEVSVPLLTLMHYTYFQGNKYSLDDKSPPGGFEQGHEQTWLLPTLVPLKLVLPMPGNQNHKQCRKSQSCQQKNAGITKATAYALVVTIVVSRIVVVCGIMYVLIAFHSHTRIYNRCFDV